MLGIYFSFVYPIGKTKEESLAVKTAGHFLEALTEYDIDGAKNMTTGAILANLSNTNKIEENNSEYMVISKTIKVLGENKNWAKLNAEIETKNRKTGIIDVHWYEMYLAFENENNWRIYRIDEAEIMLGINQDIQPQDKAEATKIFSQYLTLLSENKYDKAGELLVGKARTAHEQTKDILGKASVIKYFKEIKLDSLYYDGKDLIAEVRYLVDGRSTALTVSFFRTSEGWRIYNVSQI